MNNKLITGLLIIVINIAFFSFLYYALQVSENNKVELSGFILSVVYIGSIAFGVNGVGPLSGLFKKSGIKEEETNEKQPWE